MHKLKNSIDTHKDYSTNKINLNDENNIVHEVFIILEIDILSLEIDILSNNIVHEIYNTTKNKKNIYKNVHVG